MRPVAAPLAGCRSRDEGLRGACGKRGLRGDGRQLHARGRRSQDGRGQRRRRPGTGGVGRVAGRAAVAAEPMVASGRRVGGDAIVGTLPGGASGGSVGVSVARSVGTNPGRVTASRSSASSRPDW